jgi:hypothetical protein
MRRILLSAFGAVLLLCGCAGPVSSTAGQEQGLTAAAATPTPTAQSSTITALASEIAGYKSAVENAEEDLDPDCDIMEYGAQTGQNQGLDALTAFSCFITKSTVVIHSVSLAARLEKMAPYPAEVSELVSDTIEKANQLSAVDAGEACTEDAESDTCRLALLNYRLHRPGMDDVIAKWTPYGA